MQIAIHFQCFLSGQSAASGGSTAGRTSLLLQRQRRIESFNHPTCTKLSDVSKMTTNTGETTWNHFSLELDSFKLDKQNQPRRRDLKKLIVNTFFTFSAVIGQAMINDDSWSWTPLPCHLYRVTFSAVMLQVKTWWAARDGVRGELPFPCISFFPTLKFCCFFFYFGTCFDFAEFHPHRWKINLRTSSTSSNPRQNSLFCRLFPVHLIRIFTPNQSRNTLQA